MRHTERLRFHGFARAAATALLLAAALILAACATHRAATPLVGSLPALAPGQGRIVFYRPDDAFLGALSPDIVVNDRIVGEAIVGSVFDRPAWPGSYTVFLAGHDEDALTFALAPDETRYVRITPRFVLTNSRLVPELVDAATGAMQIQGLMQRGAAL